MRPHGAGVAVALVGALLVACGSTAQQSAPTSTTASPQKQPSKLPDAVTRTVDRLKAGETPGSSNPNFTDTGVPVRDDGSLQLELNASSPVTEAQQAELTALGAEIVAAGSKIGIVDAWVPFAKVDEAAGLSWVVSVTVPSPTRSSG